MIAVHLTQGHWTKKGDRFIFSHGFSSRRGDYCGAGGLPHGSFLLVLEKSAKLPRNSLARYFRVCRLLLTTRLRRVPMARGDREVPSRILKAGARSHVLRLHRLKLSKICARIYRRHPKSFLKVLSNFFLNNDVPPARYDTARFRSPLVNRSCWGWLTLW